MSTKVAIVGLSALLPGSPNASAFYNNVINRKSFIVSAKSEWLGGSFTTEKEYTPGKIRSRLRGSIDDIAYFNPLSFGIMPKALDGGDPDHYLSLKVAEDALRDANLPNGYDHTNTGVVVGRGTYFNRGFGTVFQHGIVVDQTIEILKEFISEDKVEEVRRRISTSLPEFNSDMVGGIIPNLVSGRIANKLGLGGPNFLIDAACASSLIAVEHACEQLALGKADLMLVGGVQASTPPQVHMVFDVLDALAKTELKPLSKTTEGTVLSEGVGFITLCLSEYAEELGLKIYAEIVSFGSSSDGKGKGLFAPSTEGQRLAIKRAYEGKVDLKGSVRYLETHATGMPLGDETEIKTILSEFCGNRTGPIHLSNIKSLIGHCIPASGIAGLINTTLAVKNGIFPPLGVDEPIKILSDNSDYLHLGRHPQPWLGSVSSPRVGAVNAFGFGGINSHIVVRQCTSKGRKISDTTDLLWNSAIFFITGRNEEEFAKNCDRILAEINDEKFHRVALESLKRAQHGSNHSGRHVRAYVIGKNPTEVCKRLELIKEKVLAAKNSEGHIVQPKGKKHTSARYSNGVNKENEPVFVYPGEGSQASGMLNELCMYFPLVNEWMSKISDALGVDMAFCEKIIESQEKGKDIGLPKEAYEVNLSTGLVFAANMCINQLLRGWGVNPKAHVGHSTGQNSAIFAGGWLSSVDDESVCEEACKQVIRMRKAWERVEGQERMEGEYKVYILQQPDVKRLKELLAEMSGEVVLSMKNCPSQYIVVCLDGEAGVIRKRLEDCCVMLFDMPIKRPYHTRYMQEVSLQMRDFYNNEIYYQEESAQPVYSCLSGTVINTKCEARKNLAELMETSVDFEKVIGNMISDGYKLFVECGNGSSTSNFIKSIISSGYVGEAEVVTSQASSREGLESFLECIGTIWTAGNEIAENYIERQASLEEKLFCGYRKRKGEVKLSLLMPRALISKGDGVIEKDFKVGSLKTKSSDENRVNSISLTTTVGRCVLSADSPVLADHLLPNRRKGYKGNQVKGQSVVPMALFVSLVVSAIKAKAGTEFAVLGKITMERWTKAQKQNEFVVLLEADGRHDIYAVKHNKESSLRCIDITTESSEIRTDAIARLGLRTIGDGSKKPYVWDRTELYEHGMFHETFYQVVKTIDYCDENFIEGVIRTTNRSSLLNLTQIVDGLAQLSAFWAAPSQGLYFHTFPAGIKRLEVGNIEGRPTRYWFSLANTAKSDARLSFNGLLQDDNGNTVLEFEDFSHSFVRLPDSYHQCFADCERSFYSQSVKTGTKEVAINIITAENNLGRYIDPKGFFLSVFRQMWFNAEEIERLGSKLQNGDIIGQLLSRKEAVRRLLGQKGVSIKARNISAMSDGSVCILEDNTSNIKARIYARTICFNGNIVSICSTTQNAVIIGVNNTKDDITGNRDNIDICMRKALCKLFNREISVNQVKCLQRVNEYTIRGTLVGSKVTAGWFSLGASSYGWAAVESKK